MSNSLIPFSDDAPDHLREMFGDEITNDDLAGGVNVGYPVIHYRGKVWSVSEGGSTTTIMRRDEDGEETPSNSIELVIVKANPHLSKVYYEDGYEEGSNEKPTCYSHDGVAPAPDAAEPQAKACLSCPHNAWGSRVTESGSKGKACSDSRRLCVVSPAALDKPMFLRVPAGSLKELVAYGDMLKRRKVPYQAVVTRISFDVEAAHPKFSFKARAWLNDSQMRQVAELMKTEVVQQILGMPTAPENRPEVATVPKTQASVTSDDVAAAIAKSPAKSDKPQLAVVSDVKEATASKKKDASTPPKKKPSKVANLLEEADAELEAALAGHFDG